MSKTNTTPDFSNSDSASEALADALRGKRLTRKTAKVLVWLLESLMEAIDSANKAVPEAALERTPELDGALMGAATIAAISRNEDTTSPSTLLLDVGLSITGEKDKKQETRDRLMREAYDNAMAGINVEDDTEGHGVFYWLRAVAAEDEAEAVLGSDEAATD